MTNATHLAFPAFDSNGECQSDAIGLTKREYFAAMAMQALLTPTSNDDGDPRKWSLSMLAEAAIMSADALIEALNKGGEQ